MKKLSGQQCPLCNDMLVLRTGRYGMFIGCNGYPDCHYLSSAHQKEATISQEESSIICPKCIQGILGLKNSRFGKTFYACVNYPNCNFTLNHFPVEGCCTFCRFPLLVKKQERSDGKLYCANKSCGEVQ